MTPLLVIVAGLLAFVFGPRLAAEAPASREQVLAISIVRVAGLALLVLGALLLVLPR